MCIGLPMQVQSIRPGHATVSGRGQIREINTALVDEPAPGDWLLVFLDAAREPLSPERATEMNAALDLLTAAMNGDLFAMSGDAGEPGISQHAGSEGSARRLGAGDGQLADPGFALPSAMSTQELARFTGAAI